MNDKLLEPYVFLTISESANRIISKNKSWDNYTQWCEYIRKYITAGNNVDSEHIVNKTLEIFEDLGDIYSFNVSESVGYVLKYFMRREWINYMPLIIANQKCYGTEMY